MRYDHVEIGRTGSRGKRYAFVTDEKVGGATYTPAALADFVAARMIDAAGLHHNPRSVRILDPAVGEGELLASLLAQLPDDVRIDVCGFDTDRRALHSTEARLRSAFPGVSLDLRTGDFLKFVLDMCSGVGPGLFFDAGAAETFDLIIANPPYVRTQVMGAKHAQRLAATFGLHGRVDLYYAFLVAISMVLRPHGVAGIIVSNRFMTTRAGATVRRAIRAGFNLRQVWDLGDTKLFSAAVLPAVLIGEGKNGDDGGNVQFTSIYESTEPARHSSASIIDALEHTGVVEVPDGRRFHVRSGTLDSSSGSSAVWRIATNATDAWLETVSTHTWRRFGEIGKIRVGVKTCADGVFIRDDWDKLPQNERPELLRPLITHHVARRFRADESRAGRRILYPHESIGGQRRAVELDEYPRSKAYLTRHRSVLESRSYVLEAGRHWYEIWVPQDPATWRKPKLVFRDIAKEPCFWVDFAGAVVNGDCYWIAIEDESLLWLAAAVANSTFIRSFYDHRFHNKLYAGRRRFITQYVEAFPLPHPESETAAEIIQGARAMYSTAGTPNCELRFAELDGLVWSAFGLTLEEVAR
ncbi:MAG: type II restriction endonuclease subunit M [Phycisphaerales bacterium]|nr:MAG: type II restriction endonuclease subunit M [Phycisphaerales bacterium]